MLLTVDRESTYSQPTVDQLSSDKRTTVGWQIADRELFYTFALLRHKSGTWYSDNFRWVTCPFSQSSAGETRFVPTKCCMKFRWFGFCARWTHFSLLYLAPCSCTFPYYNIEINPYLCTPTFLMSSSVTCTSYVHTKPLHVPATYIYPLTCPGLETSAHYQFIQRAVDTTVIISPRSLSFTKALRSSSLSIVQKEIIQHLF